MTSFSTSLLDEVRRLKKRRLESERRRMVREVFSLLPRFAQKFSFQKAYLFGSLARPQNYHAGSDIDIAVEGLSRNDLIPALSYLSRRLGRDVDLVSLERSRFRNRILKEGISWKRPGRRS